MLCLTVISPFNRTISLSRSVILSVVARSSEAVANFSDISLNYSSLYHANAHISCWNILPKFFHSPSNCIVQTASSIYWVTFYLGKKLDQEGVKIKYMYLARDLGKKSWKEIGPLRTEKSSMNEFAMLIICGNHLNFKVDCVIRLQVT